MEDPEHAAHIAYPVCIGPLLFHPRSNPLLLPAGVTAPPAPSPSELGWTGSLPHPTQYLPGGDAELLKEQAKEVRASRLALPTVCLHIRLALPQFACTCPDRLFL